MVKKYFRAENTFFLKTLKTLTNYYGETKIIFGVRKLFSEKNLFSVQQS
jgi:hypothetical protein